MKYFFVLGLILGVLGTGFTALEQTLADQVWYTPVLYVTDGITLAIHAVINFVSPLWYSWIENIIYYTSIFTIIGIIVDKIRK
jgi:hypothetical protein